MADDDKTVTKKTAAKPAATTKKAPAKAATAGVTTKKVIARPAAASTPAPRPAAPAADRAPPPKAAAPVAPKPAQPPAAPVAKANPAPVKPAAAAKKTLTKKASPTPPGAAPGKSRFEEKPVSLNPLANVSDEQRLGMIQEAAYYRAEKRDFAPGFEEEDWAAAVSEIDALIAKAKGIFGA